MRGLGQVTETYTWRADIGPPTCPSGLGKVLGYDLRLVVARKGEIRMALSDGAACVDQEAVRTQAQAFTVIGGTGIYAGASGNGTVERTLGAATAQGRSGRETWSGTLEVGGLEFDVTPPTLTGAVGRTVRAPRAAARVRVVYRVTARDVVDGPVPVLCTPRSGSRFKVGRTRVSCRATDESGNTASARFTVTVRPRR